MKSLFLLLVVMLSTCQWESPPSATTPAATICRQWVGTSAADALTLRETDSCALTGPNWETHQYYQDWVTHHIRMRQSTQNRPAAYDEITQVVAGLTDYPPVYHPEGTDAIVTLAWDQELLPSGYTFGYGVWFPYAEAVAAYQNDLRGAALVQALNIGLPDS